ncbi:MAG: UPF0158 family protein [Leptolyngbya sp.]|nr:UPF0158 family protein [Leptolyngbya sp.]
MVAISRADFDMIVMLIGAPENGDVCAYLDRETGELLLTGDGMEDGEGTVALDLDSPGAESEGRYLSLPRQNPQEGWRDMESFVDTVADTHLQNLLAGAIQGKGAFRRFKDILRRPKYAAEQERWHQFRDGQEEARVLAWLASENLQVEEA